MKLSFGFVASVSLAPALFTLTACAPDDAAPRRIPYYKDPELCTVYTPATGSRANFSKIGVSDPTTTAFGKRYNRAALDGVLTASNNETQKFAKADGLDVYKVVLNVDDGACLFQKDLPDVPGDLRERWDEVSTPSAGDGDDGIVDGLHSANFKGHAHQPTIMVRETSGRWTLVHEMLHANFWRQRQLDGVRTRGQIYYEIIYNENRTAGDLSVFESSRTEAAAMAVAKGLDERAKLLYDAQLQSSFEEVANESLLLDEWSKHNFTNVTRQAAWNASWYINYSRKVAVKDQKEITEQIESLKVSVANLGFTAVIAKLGETTLFIQHIQNQVDVLATQAKVKTAFLFEGSNNSTNTALTAGLRPVDSSGDSPIDSAIVSMTNAHLDQMNNPRELRALRDGNRRLLDRLQKLN